MSLARLVLLAGGVLVVACSGNILPPGGSCNVPSTSSCTDYTGTAWSAPTTGQQTCARVTGGSYSSSTCPTANRIASCRVESGGASEITVRYYRPLTTMVAQATCTMASGVYSAN